MDATVLADESMTYLGRNPCGCVGVLIVDAPGDKHRVAQVVAEAIRDGITIEHIKTSAIHSGENHIRPCSDNPKCVRRKEPTRTKAKQEQLL